jgi:SAM-dependent methyltransferase
MEDVKSYYDTKSGSYDEVFGARERLQSGFDGFFRKNVKCCCKKVTAKGLQHKITSKKGGIAETGYADETFDLVLCEHALFLFREPDVVVKELKRVLKKNAALIISAQNRYVQALSSLAGKPSVGFVSASENSGCPFKNRLIIISFSLTVMLQVE